MKKFNWGIIGLGEIATQFAETFDPETGNLIGAASRSLAKAETFAQAHQIPKAYGSYKEIVKDPEIDVIYIATPHNHHLDSILLALNNNKHVLCEKAITMNSQELIEAQTLAQAKGLVLAEAMTIFNMPLYQALKTRIDSDEFGALKMIQASFGSYKEADPTNRFFNQELAGGAILDIGTYALAFTRFFLSEQPNFVQSTMLPFTTGVDEQSVTILRNPQNEMATVALSFQAKMPKQGIVAFEKAFLTITDYPRADFCTITFLDGHVENFQVGQSSLAMNYEVINMSKLITGELKNPSLELTRDVMALMDIMRSQWL